MNRSIYIPPTPENKELVSRIDKLIEKVPGLSFSTIMLNALKSYMKNIKTPERGSKS